MSSPFIIAELSANHLGSVGTAYRLIEAAAEAGADAIKLQTWTPGTMCLDPDYTLHGGTWAGQKLADLYGKAETPWAWHMPLFEHGKRLGMVAFSSVFDMQALAFLESINCPMYKISSFELVDMPLIAAVAKTGKPMIMSTGMATFSEINEAYMEATRAGCEDLTLLKCTSAYPATPDQANLGAIKLLGSALRKAKVGISDHTLGLAVPIAAVAMGATVIEKHLTLSRSNGSPDASFSLEPDEFKQMVTECRAARDAVSGQWVGPQPGESTALRRSLYIAKDIKAGETITAEHLTTARPALGSPPSRMDRMIGKKMLIDATRGMPATESMVADSE